MAGEFDPKDAAQARLADSGVESGQVYKHYKGGTYQIVTTAIDEATLVPVVIYRSDLKQTAWSRPLDNFLEEVGRGPRFRLWHGERDSSAASTS